MSIPSVEQWAEETVHPEWRHVRQGVSADESLYGDHRHSGPFRLTVADGVYKFRWKDRRAGKRVTGTLDMNHYRDVLVARRILEYGGPPHNAADGRE